MISRITEKGITMKSTNRIKIEVTAKHIKKGKKKQCGECPIALAMLDAGMEEPRVYADIAYSGSFADNPEFGHRQNWDLPRSAQRFVQSFDAGRPTAKPFTFFLSPGF